ncbi:hypothetical protein BH10ACT3_BH10ACT3_05880 [soil metagenome]
MAFGQSAGPPAHNKQLEQLEQLLRDRGYDSFKEARHPFALNQRQAGGKFTGPEATELIERLEAEAIVSGDAALVDGEVITTTAPARAAKAAPSAKTTGATAPVSAASAARTAKKRREREEEVATRIEAEVMANELISRGWCCIPPE